MTREVVIALIGLMMIGVAVAASGLGWFGGVVVCGADRAPGCVMWPPLATGLVWGAFVLGVVALVVWQVRYLDRDR